MEGLGIMDETRTLVGEIVTVDGWGGVAFYVDELETVPDEDTEWSGYEVETGMLRAHMVGDDRTFVVDPDDCTILDDEAYCHGCGQIGCTADGRDV